MQLTDYLARLTITQGRHAGKPFAVLPWQRRFVRGAFAPGASTAALSVARGNGKTTLVAGIACAALDGPLMQPRGEVVVVAASFAQGRVAFDHARAFMADKLRDKKAWRIQDTAQVASIEHRETGARLRVIGSDPNKAHGLAPHIVLADEPAQWDESKGDRMRAALETAMGKIENSRFVALGTRPIGELHWFAKMLAGGCDYAQSHASAPGDKPFQKPDMGEGQPFACAHMPDLRDAIAREARAAKSDGSLLAAFQALRLNGGTADTEDRHVVGRRHMGADRRRCRTAARTAPGACWALDLGTSAAMSAVAAYWPATGALEALAAFPWEPSLAERGLKRWRRRPVRPVRGARRAGEVRPPGRRYRRAAHRCAR